MTSVSAIHSGPHSRRPQFWLFLLLVLGATAWYEGHYLCRGWNPHDEGCLTESALRVMHGQLPHRDYIEIYTGGLAYLDALAFRILGLRFVSMRIVLFAFFLAWVIAVFWIATNMVSEWIAASVTFFAVLWSLPNYSAAMPSWYNLFFATFGIAALFQFMRSRSKKWLFIAGLCAGLSFLVKIAGLYFLAAALLYCVYHEQELSASQDEKPSTHRNTAYTFFVTASLALFTALVFRMIYRGARSGEYLHFLLPVAALSGLLANRERLMPSGSLRKRFFTLLGFASPVFAGFALPGFLFVIPYIRANAMAQLYRGIFVVPWVRLENAAAHALPLVTLPFAFLVIGPFAFAASESGRIRQIVTITMLVLYAGFIALALHREVFHFLIWNTVAWSIPILTLIAFPRLWRAFGATNTFDRQKEEMLFVLLSCAVVCSLIQFPYSIPTYFCYVAPIAFLAILAFLRTLHSIPRTLLIGTGLFYGAFAMFLFTPGFIDSGGLRSSPDRESARLAQPIAEGLRVAPEYVPRYDSLAAAIHRYAPQGQIVAGPECPEVYVLSGFLNPTRTAFDFFDPVGSYDELIGRLLRDESFHVVVVNNRAPGTPGTYAKALRRQALAHGFTKQVSVDNFEVYSRP